MKILIYTCKILDQKECNFAFLPNTKERQSLILTLQGSGVLPVKRELIGENCLPSKWFLLSGEKILYPNEADSLKKDILSTKVKEKLDAKFDFIHVKIE